MSEVVQGTGVVVRPEGGGLVGVVVIGAPPELDSTGGQSWHGRDKAAQPSAVTRLQINLRNSLVEIIGVPSRLRRFGAARAKLIKSLKTELSEAVVRVNSLGPLLP